MTAKEFIKQKSNEGKPFSESPNHIIHLPFIFYDTVAKMMDEYVEKVLSDRASEVGVEPEVIKTNGGLTDREKSLILWFMELAVKMKIKNYTELSIASIDLDAWYEDYYKENELPSNALEIDEREGL